MKNLNWKKYALEFLSIFIAVISAFALNNWNDNRQSRISEEKILREIKNGLEHDLKDFAGNQHGHRVSLGAINLFRDIINQKEIGELTKDSLQRAYITLFRDYTPIVNLSGYESLKASGLKTVKDDDLRFEIITLYDFYIEIIIKLEDEVEEFKTFPNYFHPINSTLDRFMIFDQDGQLVGIESNVEISAEEKKELLSYFWRLEVNRKYKLGRYQMICTKIQDLKERIEGILE